MKNKELKVGLFSAIALVLLYFGFNFLKGKDFFETKKTYYAVYDNIDQLEVSNPVLVSGYAVGRVSHIKILQNKNNHVLVEMEIDADIVITDSTKAILNSELLGGKSVLLSMGRSKKRLNAGDTLHTEVAKGMFDVISETATPVATDLQSTLRKFNAAIDNISKNFEKLDLILAGLQKTPGLINQTLTTTNGSIETLAASFKNDAEKLSVTLDELKPTLANFKVLSDSLKRIQLNQTLVKTQRTLNSLNETLGKMKKGDNTVGRLMTEDSLYVNLNKLLINLNVLAKDFNDNPKHFLAPLGKSSKKIERDRKKAEEKK
ncbi:MAG TPA: MlaD family protein, partial [Cyclobacteriaceae bacterium]|nr:MlaD family protein [Cyclobacteriaceae bacterium]